MIDVASCLYSILDSAYRRHSLSPSCDVRSHPLQPIRQFCAWIRKATYSALVIPSFIRCRSKIHVRLRGIIPARSRHPSLQASESSRRQLPFRSYYRVLWSIFFDNSSTYFNSPGLFWNCRRQCGKFERHITHQIFPFHPSSKEVFAHIVIGFYSLFTQNVPNRLLRHDEIQLYQNAFVLTTPIKSHHYILITELPS